MNSYRSRLWSALLTLGLLMGGRAVAFAQGVTGSAVQGTVTQASGDAAEGAQVELRSSQTGQVHTTTTGVRGRYFLDNVQPGSGMS